MVPTIDIQSVTFKILQREVGGIGRNLARWSASATARGDLARQAEGTPRGGHFGTITGTIESPDPIQVRGALFKLRNGKSPLESLLVVFFRLSLRGSAALVAAVLETVHPNPGPGFRSRGREREGKVGGKRELD